MQAVLKLRQRAAQAVKLVDSAVTTAFCVVFRLPLSEREVKRRLGCLGSISARVSLSDELAEADSDEESEQYDWQVTIDDQIARRSAQQRKVIDLLCHHGAGARGRLRAVRGGSPCTNPRHAPNSAPDRARSHPLLRCQSPADKELALFLSENQPMLFDWILKLEPKGRENITRRLKVRLRHWPQAVGSDASAPRRAALTGGLPRRNPPPDGTSFRPAKALKSKEHVETEFAAKLFSSPKGKPLARCSSTFPRAKPQSPHAAVRANAGPRVSLRRTSSPLSRAFPRLLPREPQNDEDRRDAFITANCEAARVAQQMREEALAAEAELAPRLKEQAIEVARAMAVASTTEAERNLQAALERIDNPSTVRDYASAWVTGAGWARAGFPAGLCRAVQRSGRRTLRVRPKSHGVCPPVLACVRRRRCPFGGMAPCRSGAQEAEEAAPPPRTRGRPAGRRYTASCRGAAGPPSRSHPRAQAFQRASLLGFTVWGRGRQQEAGVPRRTQSRGNIWLQDRGPECGRRRGGRRSIRSCRRAASQGRRRRTGGSGRGISTTCARGSARWGRGLQGRGPGGAGRRPCSYTRWRCSRTGWEAAAAAPSISIGDTHGELLQLQRASQGL